MGNQVLRKFLRQQVTHLLEFKLLASPGLRNRQIASVQTNSSGRQLTKQNTVNKILLHPKDAFQATSYKASTVNKKKFLPRLGSAPAGESCLVCDMVASNNSYIAEL